MKSAKKSAAVRRGKMDARVLEQQVRICKAFANTTRLQILDLVGQREYSVAELKKKLGVSKANLSQHLAILKAAGIVDARRDGRHIYCRLTIPAVKQACHLIREVLRAQFRNRAALNL